MRRVIFEMIPAKSLSDRRSFFSPHVTDPTMHIPTPRIAQDARSTHEPYDDDTLDDPSVGDDDGGAGDDDDIEPNDDDELGFQTEEDEVADNDDDAGWVRDALSAGDARCNFCDGPMPCSCPAPAHIVYEDGPICGDREGW